MRGRVASIAINADLSPVAESPRRARVGGLPRARGRPAKECPSPTDEKLGRDDAIRQTRREQSKTQPRERHVVRGEMPAR